LIWIKFSAAVIDLSDAVCGIAWRTNRPQGNLERFDGFQCPSCEMVIGESKSWPPGGGANAA
jgi:hypothetical protein